MSTRRGAGWGAAGGAGAARAEARRGRRLCAQPRRRGRRGAVRRRTMKNRRLPRRSPARREHVPERLGGVARSVVDQLHFARSSPSASTRSPASSRLVFVPCVSRGFFHRLAVREAAHVPPRRRHVHDRVVCKRGRAGAAIKGDVGGDADGARARARRPAGAEGGQGAGGAGGGARRAGGGRGGPPPSAAGALGHGGGRCFIPSLGRRRRGPRGPARRPPRPGRSGAGAADSAIFGAAGRQRTLCQRVGDTTDACWSSCSSSLSMVTRCSSLSFASGCSSARSSRALRPSSPRRSPPPEQRLTAAAAPAPPAGLDKIGFPRVLEPASELAPLSAIVRSDCVRAATRAPAGARARPDRSP